jgi:hypothetical protein
LDTEKQRVSTIDVGARTAWEVDVTEPHHREPGDEREPIRGVGEPVVENLHRPHASMVGLALIEDASWRHGLVG